MHYDGRKLGLLTSKHVALCFEESRCCMSTGTVSGVSSFPVFFSCVNLSLIPYIIFIILYPNIYFLNCMNRPKFSLSAIIRKLHAAHVSYFCPRQRTHTSSSFIYMLKCFGEK
jgi:hypothetical protein